MLDAMDALRQHFKNFVNYKRAGGVAFVKQEKILRRFIVHCQDYVADTCCLPKDAVLSWNQKADHEKINNQRIRVNTVRSFAEYLQARGIPAYVGELIKSQEKGFVPYIFSNNELAKFFNAADNCNVNNISPNRSFVMPVIFRLLYSCGLRVSEATRLRICDVDLEKGVLTVLDAKFNKDRLIPVDAHMLKRLNEYSSKVLLFSKPEDPFFPAPKNRFYDPASVYNAFRVILWKAGISHGGKGFGPRVHDLRHTFAVHCLRKWVLSGNNLSVALPYLSTFLGHSGIRHSQIYLRLTAEMYPDIVEKMERKFDLLPDVGGLYETN